MTNPTPEQIEAVLSFAERGFLLELGAIDHRNAYTAQELALIKERFRLYDEGAERLKVLVAAAGAAPQERGEVLQRAHEVIKGVYANELRLPAYMLSRQAALALKQDDLLAAPPQVDEAKLAEVIAPLMPGAVTEGGATAVGIAHVVAEWLRGGGQ